MTPALSEPTCIVTSTAFTEESAHGFAQRPAAQRQKRRWANFRHVNGVAVYQEEAEQSGEQGAFMVSAIVRASPKACFQVTIRCFIDWQLASTQCQCSKRWKALQ